MVAKPGEMQSAGTKHIIVLGAGLARVLQERRAFTVQKQTCAALAYRNTELP